MPRYEYAIEYVKYTGHRTVDFQERTCTSLQEAKEWMAEYSESEKPRIVRRKLGKWEVVK